MSAAHMDRRPDVLDWAKDYGWAHDEATYDDGQIIRDEFTKNDMRLRAVWLHTPYSPAMRARGLLERPLRAPLTVARITHSTSSKNLASLEGVLTGTYPAA